MSNDQWGDFYRALFDDRAQLCALRDIWEALRSIRRFQIVGALEKSSTTSNIRFDNPIDRAQFDSGCSRIITIANRERRDE